MASNVPTVNVKPANETMARLLKHPTGIGFSSNPDGTAWPRDQFTMRRIADGDIVVVPPRTTGL